MVNWGTDERHPSIVGVVAPGVRWRVFELECCQKYFGLERDTTPEKVSAQDIINCGSEFVFWKLHTESTDPNQLAKCQNVASSLPTVKHINDPRHWLACHAKEKAFQIWKNRGIPCPQWFEFSDKASFLANQWFDYPMIVRLNNSTSGWFSYLCNDDQQAMQAIQELQSKGMSYNHDGIPNTGVGRKMIAVKYIKTTRPENVNMSFRIIVAGNRVVTGYARLGPASDWIAITNRFEKWMEEPFLKYQKLCQKFCEENESLIVKSVSSLGLNFQGVDVILDQQDNPWFIEVQPGFSVGYADLKSWLPPYYNPSKPRELVDFLLRNTDRIKSECPLYARWLDKYSMFDTAFAALKESM